MRPSGFVFADFDDDGIDDLAESTRRTMNLSPFARINILAGDPAVGLSLAATLQVGDPAQRGGVEQDSMHGQDFDGDGRIDLAFIEEPTFGFGFQSHLRIWLSQGGANFTESFDHAFDPNTHVESVAGEFTGDGVPDVITHDEDGLRLWAGIGGGLLAMPLPPVPPVDVTAVVPQHFDGDGITDLYVVSPAGPMIMLGQPGGTFLDIAPPACAGALRSGTDIDEDGFADLTCRAGDTLETHFGLGDGTFEPPMVTVFPPGTLPITTPRTHGDFDGDGVLDLVWVESGGFQITNAYVLRGLGDGTYALPQLLVQDTGVFDHWQQGAHGYDVNGDGVTDLLIPHATVINSYSMRMFLSDP